MKTSNLKVSLRIRNIAKKLAAVDKALLIAAAGLSSANRKNPFWSKSDAMKTLNQLRKMKKQLSKIWCLEFALSV